LGPQLERNQKRCDAEQTPEKQSHHSCSLIRRRRTDVAVSALLRRINI
jgi:hypothetical protein